MWSRMKWPRLPPKWQGWRLTARKRHGRLVKSFVLAEACVSRTHRQHRRCRPPVLKTGTITGPHALPYEQPTITTDYEQRTMSSLLGLSVDLKQFSLPGF